MPPIIERMTSDDLHADNGWWHLYESAFPASEREPPAVIQASLRHERGGMAFRAVIDGATEGLATTHVLRDPPAVFLVYLAVTERSRRHGLGAALFEYAWKAGADDLRRRGLAPLGIVWEIDPPAQSAVAGRRLTFFERLGGQPIDRPYHQPPVDAKSLMPMTLMFRPDHGQPLPERGVVDRLVRAMYREKYAAINRIESAVLDSLFERDVRTQSS